jgi:putative oxidoreductase
MSASGKIRVLVMGIASRLDRVAWVGPLLARVTLAGVFIPSGWGKLHDLGKVASYFEELQIPAPHFNAFLVASTELVGGILVLVGFATRVASLPLAFTMLIAILTAKRAEIHGFTSLVAFDEFAYLTMFLWLAVAGAGRASLDHLLLRKSSSTSAVLVT